MPVTTQPRGRAEGSPSRARPPAAQPPASGRSTPTAPVGASLPVGPRSSVRAGLTGRQQTQQVHPQPQRAGAGAPTAEPPAGASSTAAAAPRGHDRAGGAGAALSSAPGWDQQGQARAPAEGGSAGGPRLQRSTSNDSATGRQSPLPRASHDWGAEQAERRRPSRNTAKPVSEPWDDGASRTSASSRPAAPPPPAAAAAVAEQGAGPRAGAPAALTLAAVEADAEPAAEPWGSPSPGPGPQRASRSRSNMARASDSSPPLFPFSATELLTPRSSGSTATASTGPNPAPATDTATATAHYYSSRSLGGGVGAAAAAGGPPDLFAAALAAHTSPQRLGRTSSRDAGAPAQRQVGGGASVPPDARFSSPPSPSALSTASLPVGPTGGATVGLRSSTPLSALSAVAGGAEEAATGRSLSALLGSAAAADARGQAAAALSRAQAASESGAAATVASAAAAAAAGGGTAAAAAAGSAAAPPFTGSQRGSSMSGGANCGGSGSLPGAAPSGGGGSGGVPGLAGGRERARPSPIPRRVSNPSLALALGLDSDASSDSSRARPSALSAAVAAAAAGVAARRAMSPSAAVPLRQATARPPGGHAAGPPRSLSPPTGPGVAMPSQRTAAPPALWAPTVNGTGRAVEYDKKYGSHAAAATLAAGGGSRCASPAGAARDTGSARRAAAAGGGGLDAAAASPRMRAEPIPEPQLLHVQPAAAAGSHGTASSPPRSAGASGRLTVRTSAPTSASASVSVVASPPSSARPGRATIVASDAPARDTASTRPAGASFLGFQPPPPQPQQPLAGASAAGRPDSSAASAMEGDQGGAREGGPQQHGLPVAVERSMPSFGAGIGDHPPAFTPSPSLVEPGAISQRRRGGWEAAGAEGAEGNAKGAERVAEAGWQAGMGGRQVGAGPAGSAAAAAVAVESALAGGTDALFQLQQRLQLLEQEQRVLRQQAQAQQQQQRHDVEETICGSGALGADQHLHIRLQHPQPQLEWQQQRLNQQQQQQQQQLQLQQQQQFEQQEHQQDDPQLKQSRQQQHEEEEQELQEWQQKLLVQARGAVHGTEEAEEEAAEEADEVLAGAGGDEAAEPGPDTDADADADADAAAAAAAVPAGDAAGTLGRRRGPGRVGRLSRLWVLVGCGRAEEVAEHLRLEAPWAPRELLARVQGGRTILHHAIGGELPSRPSKRIHHHHHSTSSPSHGSRNRLAYSRCPPPEQDRLAAVAGAVLAAAEGAAGELLAAREEEGGYTAAHWAVMSRNLPLLEVLLARECQAWVDTPCKHAGHTPLHMALRGADAPAAQRLLAAGADPRLQDHTGRCPATVALRPSGRPSRRPRGSAGGESSGARGLLGCGEGKGEVREATQLEEVLQGLLPALHTRAAAAAALGRGGEEVGGEEGEDDGCGDGAEGKDVGGVDSLRVGVAHMLEVLHSNTPKAADGLAQLAFRGMRYRCAQHSGGGGGDGGYGDGGDTAGSQDDCVGDGGGSGSAGCEGQDGPGGAATGEGRQRRPHCVSPCLSYDRSCLAACDAWALVAASVAAGGPGGGGEFARHLALLLLRHFPEAAAHFGGAAAAAALAAGCPEVVADVVAELAQSGDLELQLAFVRSFRLLGVHRSAHALLFPASSHFGRYGVGQAHRAAAAAAVAAPPGRAWPFPTWLLRRGSCRAKEGRCQTGKAAAAAATGDVEVGGGAAATAPRPPHGSSERNGGGDGGGGGGCARGGRCPGPWHPEARRVALALYGGIACGLERAAAAGAATEAWAMAAAFLQHAELSWSGDGGCSEGGDGEAGGGGGPVGACGLLADLAGTPAFARLLELLATRGGAPAAGSGEVVQSGGSHAAHRCARTSPAPRPWVVAALGAVARTAGAASSSSGPGAAGAPGASWSDGSLPAPGQLRGALDLGCLDVGLLLRAALACGSATAVLAVASAARRWVEGGQQPQPAGGPPLGAPFLSGLDPLLLLALLRHHPMAAAELLQVGPSSSGTGGTGGTAVAVRHRCSAMRQQLVLVGAAGGAEVGEGAWGDAAVVRLVGLDQGHWPPQVAARVAAHMAAVRQLAAAGAGATPRLVRLPLPPPPSSSGGRHLDRDAAVAAAVAMADATVPAVPRGGGLAGGGGQPEQCAPSPSLVRGRVEDGDGRGARGDAAAMQQQQREPSAVAPKAQGMQATPPRPATGRAALLPPLALLDDSAPAPATTPPPVEEDAAAVPASLPARPPSTPSPAQPPLWPLRPRSGSLSGSSNRVRPVEVGEGLPVAAGVAGAGTEAEGASRAVAIPHGRDGGGVSGEAEPATGQGQVSSASSASRRGSGSGWGSGLDGAGAPGAKLSPAGPVAEGVRGRAAGRLPPTPEEGGGAGSGGGGVPDPDAATSDACRLDVAPAVKREPDDGAPAHGGEGAGHKRMGLLPRTVGPLAAPKQLATAEAEQEKSGTTPSGTAKQRSGDGSVFSIPYSPFDPPPCSVLDWLESCGLPATLVVWAVRHALLKGGSLGLPAATYSSSDTAVHMPYGGALDAAYDALTQLVLLLREPYSLSGGQVAAMLLAAVGGGGSGDGGSPCAVLAACAAGACEPSMLRSALEQGVSPSVVGVLLEAADSLPGRLMQPSPELQRLHPRLAAAMRPHWSAWQGGIAQAAAAAAPAAAPPLRPEELVRELLHAWRKERWRLQFWEGVLRPTDPLLPRLRGLVGQQQHRHDQHLLPMTQPSNPFTGPGGQWRAPALTGASERLDSGGSGGGGGDAARVAAMLRSFASPVWLPHRWLVWAVAWLAWLAWRGAGLGCGGDGSLDGVIGHASAACACAPAGGGSTGGGIGAGSEQLVSVLHSLVASAVPLPYYGAPVARAATDACWGLFASRLAQLELSQRALLLAVCATMLGLLLSADGLPPGASTSGGFEAGPGDGGASARRSAAAWPFGQSAQTGGGGNSAGAATAASVLACLLLLLAAGAVMEQLVLLLAAVAVQRRRRQKREAAHWRWWAGGGLLGWALELACSGLLPAALATLVMASGAAGVRPMAGVAAAVVLVLAARLAAAAVPLSARLSVAADRLALVAHELWSYALLLCALAAPFLLALALLMRPATSTSSAGVGAAAAQLVGGGAGAGLRWLALYGGVMGEPERAWWSTGLATAALAAYALLASCLLLVLLAASVAAVLRARGGEHAARLVRRRARSMVAALDRMGPAAALRLAAAALEGPYLHTALAAAPPCEAVGGGECDGTAGEVAGWGLRGGAWHMGARCGGPGPGAVLAVARARGTSNPAMPYRYSSPPPPPAPLSVRFEEPPSRPSPSPAEAAMAGPPPRTRVSQPASERRQRSAAAGAPAPPARGSSGSGDARPGAVTTATSAAALRGASPSRRRDVPASPSTSRPRHASPPALAALLRAQHMMFAELPSSGSSACGTPRAGASPLPAPPVQRPALARPRAAARGPPPPLSPPSWLPAPLDAQGV
ncbi:hypothetical protein TSOC_001659 [Tetrabaena socialis]|uniref:Uncharacterized protein n=1 Tax=Tetrabaena socialis TaxID=47790 RepID=A0A2J8AGC3_9CHLO|nr:hypothetical protein TSOC_001659 [Tetrabaena socialis]|eukprot:PNH11574.1 hypothetical protein TSOC_001659 [Tetrabaena socialis]